MHKDHIITLKVKNISFKIWRKMHLKCCAFEVREKVCIILPQAKRTNAHSSVGKISQTVKLFNFLNNTSSNESPSDTCAFQEINDKQNTIKYNLLQVFKIPNRVKTYLIYFSQTYQVTKPNHEQDKTSISRHSISRNQTMVHKANHNKQLTKS